MSFNQRVKSGFFRFLVLVGLLFGSSAYAGVPSTPSLSVPSSDSDGRYTVSWGYSSGASRYELVGEQSGTLYSGTNRSSGRNKGNGTYYYKVRACNSSGCSAYSGKKGITVSILTPPPTPSLSVPSSDSDGTYTVSWGSASRATRYELQGELSGTIYSGSGRSTTRSKPNGTYYYKVRACNSSGCSAYSGKKGITVNIPPPVPSNPVISLASLDTDGSYYVSWTASSGATSYQLQGENAGTLYSGSGRVLQRTKPDGTYSYQVRACNNSGCSAYSPTRTITVDIPLPVPGTPAVPSASLSGGNDIRVSWGAVNHAAYYYRDVSINNGAWQNKTKFTTTSVNYNDQQARSYKYRVQACNADHVCSGYSGASNTVTVLPVPAAPTVPTATLANGNNVTVSWGSVANAAHYYRDVSENGGGWKNRTKVNGTNMTINNLDPGHYEYRVQACNAHDKCSAYSGTSAKVTVLVVPVAPNKPSVTKSGGNNLTVSWNAPVSAVAYQLQRSINGSSWNNQGALVASNSVTMTNQGTGNHKFRVKACNAHAICSAYSVTSDEVRILPVPATPAKPAVSLAGGDDITISWDAVANAAHYYREVSINNGSWQNSTKVNNTSIIYYDQQPRSYRYRVKACNSDEMCSGFSTNSDTVTVLPVPAVPPAPIVSVNGGNDITSTWVAIANAAHYYQQVNINGAGWTERTQHSGTNVTMLDRAAGSYVYRVQACNSNDVCSAYSSGSVAVTVLPVPAKPAAPIATLADGNDITANWTAVANADHYIREVSVNATAWKNPTQYSGTSASMVDQVTGNYRYRVKACNADSICSAFSNTSNTIAVLAIPTEPAAPVATISGRDDITVSWNAVPDADHYYREVSINNGAWQNRTQFITTSVQYLDQQERSYKYRIQACNEAGNCSDYSPASQTVTVGPAMVVEQFEWIPSEVLVGEQTSFHWNITHAAECFVESGGNASQTPRAASGQTPKYVYDEPVVHQTKWYCQDAYGNRIPEQHDQYLEATRTVRAIAGTDVATVDISDLNLKTKSYNVNWTGGNAATRFQLVEEKDGVWGEPIELVGINSKRYSAKAQGRYRYKVRACEEDACSTYKTSIAFNINAFSQSGDVSNHVSLAGLSNDVGFTAGQFRVSESGAATYSVPLNLPEGVAGVKPQVSLNYSSQAGDGAMGRGWSLAAGGAISRCPANFFHNGEIRGVNYNDSDLFCLQGQQLVMSAGNNYGEDGSTYHTRIDNFSVITAHGTANNSGPLYFTVSTKSGDTYYYGQTPDSDDNGDAFVEPNRTSAGNDVAKYWALKKVVDISGNAIRYHYNEDTAAGAHTLARIEYGKNENVGASRYFNQVNFNYIANPKPQVGYAGGSVVSMNQLLDSIGITVDGESYRYYQLSYFATDVIEERNYLDSITECISQNNQCLAPLSFTWNRPDPVTSSTQDVTECEPEPDGGQFCFTYPQTTTTNFAPFGGETRLNYHSRGRQSARMFDINADGYSDIIYADSGWKVLYGPNFSNTPQSLSTIGSGDNERQYALTIDYNGDGKMELLVANNATSNWYVLTYNPRTVKREHCFGGRRDECEEYSYNVTYETVNLGIVATGFEGAAQIMDVDGDGLQDIVFSANNQIQMYSNNGTGGFNAAVNLTNLGEENNTEFSYNHSLHTPTMKNSAAIDINGDGRSDLLTKVRTRTAHCDGVNHDGPFIEQSFCKEMGGTWRYEYTTRWKLFVSDGTMAEPRLTEKGSLGYSGDDLRVTDVNGDGLTDIIYRLGGNKTWYYALSDGEQLGVLQSTRLTTDDDKIHSTYFIDLNADGRVDILKPVSDTLWSILISRPTDSADKIVWEYRGSVARDKDDVVLFGDVNGDAKMDLVTTENDDGWQVRYAARSNIVDHVITEIDNGWDVDTTITYDTMLKDAVNILDEQGNRIVGDEIEDTIIPTAGYAVVKHVATDVSDSARKGVSYRYGGMLLHRKGLGSLGYKLLHTTDDQTSVTTISSYSQQYPFIGIPLSTTEIAPDGTSLLSDATNVLKSIESTHNGGIYPYIDIATETQYQIGSDGVHRTLSTTKTNNDFDGWGNLTRSVVTTLDGSSVVHTTVTSNTFGSERSYEQQMGRLQTASVVKTPASGSAITRNSSYSYYSDGEICQSQAQIKGMLKSSTINGLTTTTCYDGFGNKSKASKTGILNEGDTNPTTISVSKIYSSDGRILSSTTDAAGNTTTHQYNGRVATGSVTGLLMEASVTDANNKTETQYFDNWGRVLAVTSPVGSAKTTKTAYCSNNCTAGGKYYFEQTQAGKPTKITTFDKFGREVATKVQHFEDGNYTYVFKDYDNHGRLSKEYLPSFSNNRSSNSSDYTKYNYDVYGRLISKQLPNADDSGYHNPGMSYAGLVTTKTDAKGQSRIETRNMLGQLIRVEDANNGVLNYVYDAQGKLDKVTKSGDGLNIVQIDNAHNSYGQQIGLKDIDKGEWSYRYNAFGQLIWQQDGNGAITLTEYDTAGRKVKQSSSDFTQCWIFGTSANPNANGKLVENRYFTGSGNHQCGNNDFNQSVKMLYDTAGRVYQSIEQLKGLVGQLNGEYHTFREFDNLGRLYKQHYPGLGLSIRHQYKNGHAYRLVNDDTGRVYQHIASMNANGQVTQVNYANGASEAIGYDDESGLVTSHILSKNGTLHNLAYGYDANGNLNWRSHTFAPASNNADYREDYSYDGLDRLTGRVVTRTSDVSAGFSMNEQYRYDSFGNFTRKHDKYYQHNNDKQLTGIYSNASFSGTAEYRFSYDGNGNVINDGNRTIAYASFDKPIAISKAGVSTNFAYGINHVRYYRRDVRSDLEVHTAYLNGVEKHYNIKGQNEKLEYKVYIGNVIITERSDQSSNIATDEHYLHKDHLGSPLSITDKSGTLVAQNVYDPWGKAHSLYLNTIAVGDNLRPTQEGFSGHEQVDELNIVHMNGRIYDPNIGRFLQADPHIQAPKNTQSFNRYAYVLNNPLSYTDPTGYFFKSLFKFVKKYWRQIASIAVMFIPGVNVIVLGALSGYISTGSLKGALIGAFTAGFASPAGGLKGFLINGLVGGIASKAMGGKFGHGFITAGIGSLAGSHIRKLSSPTLKVIIKAVVGGTMSKLTGGKFGNGAMSAAFSQAMASGVSGEFNTSTAPNTSKQKVTVDTTQIKSQEDKKFVSDYLDSLDNDAMIDSASLIKAKLAVLNVSLAVTFTREEILMGHIQRNVQAASRALVKTSIETIGTVAGFCGIPQCQAVSWGAAAISSGIYGEHGGVWGNYATEVIGNYAETRLRLHNVTPDYVWDAASGGLSYHISNEVNENN